MSTATLRSVEYIGKYKVAVTFTDCTHGTINLRDRLFGPMFEPLRDEAFFRQVSVDEFGAICSPNGADLAPDAIYAQLVSEQRRQAPLAQ